MSSVRDEEPAQTMPSLLRKSAQESFDRCFIHWVDPSRAGGPPVPITFEEFETMVRKAIAGLRSAGVQPGDKVLFLAENSPAWQALALAAQSLRVETAALFASLGILDVVDIACRVLPKLVFVSNETQWAKLERVLSSLGCCQKVITADPSLKIPERFSSLSLSELWELPPVSKEEFGSLIEQIRPDDPFVMIFTSGTTGRQKGVRIPQKAVFSALKGAVQCTQVGPEDVGLHILPFGHIAGLGAFYGALQSQSGLILCSRREDLLKGFSLKPTYTLLVPLLYERIWKEVLRKIHQKPAPLSRLLRRLLDAASHTGNGRPLKFWGRLGLKAVRALVARPLAAQLGGRMRFLASGGALSDPEMVAFYRGLGFNYLNFYGMSETSGVIALNCIDDPHIRVNSVGRPWREVEVKISEEGEILVKGKTLMTGYLEKEGNWEATTEDGYFKTGDMGWRDEEGYLYITGRKKNTFVLSTGKKVTPEMIELKLREILPMVNDAVLVGDGEAFVSAGLFVSKELLRKLNSDRGIEGTKTYFLGKIRQGCAGLSDYEIPKQVFLIEGAPYDYPKMITPTLKIKRNEFVKLFSEPLSEIYHRFDFPRSKRAAMRN